MAPQLGALFAAALADYPSFRYILKDHGATEFPDALQLTFEYYIALMSFDGGLVLGAWDDETLVGGMLIRRPEAVDDFDPSDPVTVEYRAKVGEAAWQRLDAFEVMIEEHTPSPANGCFHIDLIAVDPAQQGKGYGRQMLDYVAELARSHPKSNLVCLATEAAEKHAFYEHFGYEKLSTATLGPLHSTNFMLQVETP